jgi:hypothetical protein
LDGVILAVVIATRILVPLAIPRYPLPAMLAALVIDGLDQTIFQTFTSLDLDGYQSYAFGVSTDATWSEAIANRPAVIAVVALAIGLLAVGAWWLLTRRLPPADRPLTFDADVRQEPVDPSLIERERRRLAERLVDRELLEKIVFVSLVSIIFGRMLPGVDTSPAGTALGVAIVIVANTLISEALVRRGRQWSSAARQFGVMLALNLVILAIGQAVLATLTGRRLEHALVFVLLLTLIVTLYDRYRPIHLARFAGQHG